MSSWWAMQNSPWQEEKQAMILSTKKRTQITMGKGVFYFETSSVDRFFHRDIQSLTWVG
jgi:hypothetical protein